MTREVFMTGATGFVGSELLRRWLDASDVRVNLLVRTRREERANERVRALLAELYPGANGSSAARRVKVWEGDVSEENFGLDAGPYAELASATSHVIHCAAAARFDLDLDAARKINVGGAGNVLTFASRCPGLKRVDYIGTAYVAGERKGIVTEDELDTGQRHRNTYERTKFESEKYVRRMMADLPIAIFRPSIVTCDSKTGRASNHNGFYRLLRAYHLGALQALPGNPDARLDLIPGDYVAAAAFSISAQESSLGKCYHLTAGVGRSTTLAEVRGLAAEFFGREPFQLVPPAEFERRISQGPASFNEQEKRLVDEVGLYAPYLTCELEFDNRNAVALTGVTAPPVTDYFGTLSEFIKKHA